MKSILLVLLLCCPACAVDLHDYGLDSMQVMSDSQAMEIRGSGYVSVSGYSYAGLFGSVSYNRYSAHGFRAAYGGSNSYTGYTIYRRVFASGYAYALAQ